MKSIRHPRRRAVSIGPQSEADAYEALAYREKRRRDSRSSAALSPVSSTANGLVDPPNGHSTGKTTAVDPSSPSDGTDKLSKLEIYEGMMGTGFDPAVTSTPTAIDGPNIAVSPADQTASQLETNEMFSKLQKPRVRYDVEVVTKLIVYSGAGLFQCNTLFTLLTRY